jgi:hypothetical protein
MNYSIETVLEIIEDAPEMVTVYFTTNPETMEGRRRDNIEIEYVTDIDGDEIDHEPHTDDLVKAIKQAEGKWDVWHD